MTRSIFAVVLISMTACAMPQAPNPARAVEARITADSLGAVLRFLADDALEGRGVGSRGDELARLYLRTQLALCGLQPGNADGSWDQPVPILGITAAVKESLTVRGANGEATFQAPDDYIAVAGNGEPSAAWKDAEVVFIGYGIHAPEQGWDDFGDFDLKGKVALVMNDDPSGDPKRFGGKSRLYYGRWSYKYEEAARRGALGAIVIHTTPSAGYPFQVIQATHGKEAFWLPFEANEPTLAIRSWCGEDVAKRLAALGGHDLDELRTKAEKGAFRPVPLGVKANLAIANTVREVQSGNVLGKLEGSDPVLKNQVVVVTAHFDHLGIGTPKKDDAIYNGALDNASGCAAMLNLARACAELPAPPRRTLLFVAVTAEESGLLGSRYFARHPPVEARQMIANFNIDGVNIWGPTRDLSMVGHGKNELTALAEQVAKSRGRSLVPEQNPGLGLYYRSDHFSLARVGVPSAYFEAGSDFLENPEGRARIKAMYTTTHYHQPSDQWDARWNLEGAAEDARLVLECLLRCANADQQPRWTAGDEFERLWSPAR